MSIFNGYRTTNNPPQSVKPIYLNKHQILIEQIRGRDDWYSEMAAQIVLSEYIKQRKAQLDESK